jgi:hypothetical protein
MPLDMVPLKVAPQRRQAALKGPVKGNRKASSSSIKTRQTNQKMLEVRIKTPVALTRTPALMAPVSEENVIPQSKRKVGNGSVSMDFGNIITVRVDPVMVKDKGANPSLLLKSILF